MAVGLNFSNDVLGLGGLVGAAKSENVKIAKANGATAIEIAYIQEEANREKVRIIGYTIGGIGILILLYIILVKV